MGYISLCCNMLLDVFVAYSVCSNQGLLNIQCSHVCVCALSACVCVCLY